MSAFHKYKWLSSAHKCHLKVNFKVAASNIHTNIASFMLKATVCLTERTSVLHISHYSLGTQVLKLTRQGSNYALCGKNDAHRFIALFFFSFVFKFISFDIKQKLKLSVHLKTYPSTVFFSNKLLVTMVEMLLKGIQADKTRRAKAKALGHVPA